MIRFRFQTMEVLLYMFVVSLSVCVDCISIGGQRDLTLNREEKCVKRVHHNNLKEALKLERQSKTKLEEILLQCVQRTKEPPLNEYKLLTHYDHLIETLSVEKGARLNLERIVKKLDSEIDELTNNQTVQLDNVYKDVEDNRKPVDQQEKKMIFLETEINGLKIEKGRLYTKVLSLERNLTAVTDEREVMRRENGALSRRLNKVRDDFDGFIKVYQQNNLNTSDNLKSIMDNVNNHDSYITDLKSSVKDMRSNYSKSRVTMTSVVQNYSASWRELSHIKHINKAIENDIRVFKDLDIANKLKRTDQKIKELNTDVYELKNDLINVKNVTITTKTELDTASRECSDLNIVESGIYTVSNAEKERLNVYCLLKNRIKWTVFQRRSDGSVNFDKTWNEYKAGFGNVSGEFWLGNDVLHSITSTGNYKLRVELTKKGGQEYYAEYDVFAVANESDNYRLTVTGYSGNAGNSLNHHEGTWKSNGMSFSTRDRDKDRSNNNCAAYLKSGWWYNYCGSVYLNIYPGRWPYNLGWSNNIVKSMMMITRT